MMNKTPSSNYKVRFHDCDMFGHLNNARYLDYMISARQDHLKDFYDFDYHSYYKMNQGWVISYHEIQYLKPAYFEEEVCIQSALLGVDNNSLQVEVIMWNSDRSQLKAILRSRLTLIDIKSGAKEQHKPEFIEWAESLVLRNVNPAAPLRDRIRELSARLKESKAT